MEANKERKEGVQNDEDNFIRKYNCEPSQISHLKIEIKKKKHLICISSNTPETSLSIRSNNSHEIKIYLCKY